ncbi:hypothetical protein COBT_000179 [Conglomerata obtusa]
MTKKMLLIFLISFAFKTKCAEEKNEWFSDDFVMELGYFSKDHLNSFKHNICFAVIRVDSTVNFESDAIGPLVKIIDSEIENLIDRNIGKKDYNYGYIRATRKIVLKSFLSSMIIRSSCGSVGHDFKISRARISENREKIPLKYCGSKYVYCPIKKTYDDTSLKTYIYISKYEDENFKHNLDDFNIYESIFTPLLDFIEKNKFSPFYLKLYLLKIEEDCLRDKLINVIRKKISEQALEINDQFLYFPEYKFDEKITSYIDFNDLTNKCFGQDDNRESLNNLIKENVILQKNQLNQEKAFNCVSELKQLACRVVGNNKCYYKIIDYYDYSIDNSFYKIAQSYDLHYINSKIEIYKFKNLYLQFYKENRFQFITEIDITDKINESFIGSINYEAIPNDFGKQNKKFTPKNLCYIQNQRYNNIKKLVIMYVYNEIDILKHGISALNDYELEFEKNEKSFKTKSSMFGFLYYTIKKNDESIILGRSFGLALENITFLKYNALNEKSNYLKMLNNKLKLESSEKSEDYKKNTTSDKNTKDIYNLFLKNYYDMIIDDQFDTFIEICNKIFVEFFYIREFAKRGHETFDNLMSYVNEIFFDLNDKAEKEKDDDLAHKINVKKSWFSELPYLYIYEKLCDSISITKFVAILFDSNLRKTYIQEIFADYYNCKYLFKCELICPEIETIIQSKKYNREDIDSLLSLKYCSDENEDFDYINLFIPLFIEFEHFAAKAKSKILEEVLASLFEFRFSIQ